jgi:YD repeat-containing protein
MKKIGIFIVLLFITFSAQAQTTVATPIIIPPSPNATSLGIYGDIPVGHYTGIPSINIPLSEVVSGDIRLPINLSYHASGIKVAQEASWVGLGWALNAGGVITRSIRGWDDFSGAPWGYVRTDMFPPADGSNCLNTSSAAYGGLITILDYVHSNQMDAEPDIFYYNFGNYSGKMVFHKQRTTNDSEMQALILNQDPIDIRYNISKQIWTVITPDGCTYTFGTPENNYIYSSVKEPTYPSYGNTPKFSENNLRERYPQPVTTNSWYLDTIQSPQGDRIQFNYTRQPRKIKSQRFTARNYGVIDDAQYINTNHSNSFLNINHPVSFSSYDIYGFSQFETDETILDEIIFNNGNVKFEPVNRGDLLYTDYGTGLPQRLSKMYVTNSSGQTVTSYQFMTSYGGSNNPDERRLFLDSIMDMSGKTHRFYYNQTVLPKKTSVVVDHWGYYNGKTSNQAANIYTAIPSYTSGKRHFVGADRDATDDAQAGILTKIIYPTGGYSEFEYSLNEYSNQIMEKSYKNTTVAHSYLLNVAQPPSLPFVLSGTANVHVAVSLSMLVNPFSCTGEVFQLTPDWSYIYFYLQRQYAAGGWSDIWQSGGYNKILCNEYNAGTMRPLEYNITLDPGTYRIRSTPSTFTSGYSSTSELPEFIVTITMNISQEEPISFYRKGGGLRIKKITHFDGKDFSTVHYDYTKKSGDTIISSGKLMSFPVYNYQYIVHKGYTSTDGGEALFTVSVSESIIPLGTSAQGNPVGYDQVAEIRESNEYGGKTVYYFHNQEEYVDTKCRIPGIPNRVYNSNGLLKKKEYWDAQYRPVREEYYQHQEKYDTRQVVKGFKTFSFPNVEDCYLYKFYDTASEWWYLEKDSTVVYDYNVSPAQKITTANRYRYDNSLHKQVTARATTNSDGTTTDVIYKYPSDYNSAPYTAMVQRHIINPVIASETRLTNGSTAKVIDAEMQQYKEFYPDIFKPEITKKLETNTRVVAGTDYTALMKEVISYKYNSQGKNIELMSRDGMTTTYLWGYQHRYPIAEIIGVSYEQVKTVLGEDFINNLAAATSPDVKDLDIRLRNGFKDKMVLVTTYTYQSLIGMTSQTDPNGITTYYEYDNANRLKIVRDHEGNVLKQYEYHYHQNE